MATDPHDVLEVLAELVAERLAARGVVGPALPPAELTAREVARRLELHPETVRSRMRAGEMPGRRVGRGWRVSPDELAAYLRGEAATKRQDDRRVADARAWVKAEKARRRGGAS